MVKSNSTNYLKVLKNLIHHLKKINKLKTEKKISRRSVLTFPIKASAAVVLSSLAVGGLSGLIPKAAMAKNKKHWQVSAWSGS
mgnify:CR=1 FL=1